MREIVVRGARGGPLEPLAAQLNHDVIHLQGRRLEDMVGQLADEVREALTVGLTAAQSRDETFEDEWQRYLQAVARRYRGLDMAVLTPAEQDDYLVVRLADVFVPQHVLEDPPLLELPKEMWRRLVEAGEVAESELHETTDDRVLARARAARKQLRRSALTVTAALDERLVVMLGDPGAGKSTLARYIAVALTEETAAGPLEPLSGWLPILIELRNYADPQWRSSSFLDYYDHLHRTQGVGLPKDMLMEFLRVDGRVVAIFDGLDEVFDPKVRETIAHEIASFATLHNAARIIVTSRPIGYKRGILETAGFTLYTLQDFDRSQIAEFVACWYDLASPDAEEAAARRERLLEAVDGSASVLELAGNPMLLTILAIIGRRQELPRDRRAVYKHTVSVLIEHWDVNKHLRDSMLGVDMSYIDHEDKLELLRQVASAMQHGADGLAGNRILGPDLQACFLQYLQDVYRLSPGPAKTVAKAMLAQLRERNFILCRFGSEVYGFVHRAFLEYMCADGIVRAFQDRIISEEQLLSEVYGSHWRDPAWQEVLRLITGMIRERFAGPAIDYLLKANPQWHLETSQPPGHLMLATRCMAEIRKPAIVAAQAGRLTDALFEVMTAAIQADLPDIQVLTKLAEVGREAVHLIPPGYPGHAEYLSNLGIIARSIFEMTGYYKYLDQAASYGRQALRLVPDDSPGREWYLFNLSVTLQASFSATGARTPLDESITLSQEANQITPAGHPIRPALLSHYASALLIRFLGPGNKGSKSADPDLAEAIAASREAVIATSADDPGRADRLDTLSRGLRIRFEQTADPADLDDSIAAARESVTAAPADHFHRARYLSSLGSALQTRFERTGNLTDAAEAIDTSRAALRVTPIGDPSLPARLSGLGTALMAPANQTGDSALLDEAAAVFRQAVEATPDDHPDRARYLSNLGDSLRIRFVQTADPADLDQAIAVIRAAIQATSTDHPAGAVSHSGLDANLSRVVGAVNVVVADAISNDPNQHSYLANLRNLGNALRARFEQTGDPADLDQAITVIRQAIEIISPDHPDQARYLSDYASVLRARFERTRSVADAEQAISGYARAAGLASAAPSVRIDAARIGALLAAESSPEAAANLLEIAVRLLPQVTPRPINRAEQPESWIRFSPVINDAAALALNLGRPERALELIEQGRVTLYSLAFESESSLTELYVRHPALAARFTELRDQLDSASAATVALTPRDEDVAARRENPAAERRRAATEFDSLVARVRNIDGFEAFLLPPTASQLANQGDEGPIVMVNISRFRCDAIALTTHGVRLIPLPDLALDVLTDKISTFYQALGTVHDPEQSIAKRASAGDVIMQTLEWLWDTTTEPVLRSLGYLKLPEAGTAWPRVWWTPCGPMGMLPLHAAGHHLTSGRSDTVMDRVISSYTPNVQMLAQARSRVTLSSPTQSLIVAMPITPGASPLPGTHAEAMKLQGILPDPTLLMGDAATKARVLSCLSTTAVAHFACHAAGNFADPSRSLLMLHDHEQAPLTAASLASTRLDLAQLAYVSTSEIYGDALASIPDEAIRLTTAFHYAGFTQVIGLMWQVPDREAAVIAAEFFTLLTTSPLDFDTSNAAEALHRIMRILRDKNPSDPSIWAAYLHSGV
jgi:tetratricopeptide (TPR) repeat protein/energy-coupling factor transporter ATP-binding protein EcfA2